MEVKLQHIMDQEKTLKVTKQSKKPDHLQRYDSCHQQHAWYLQSPNVLDPDKTSFKSQSA